MQSDVKGFVEKEDAVTKLEAGSGSGNKHKFLWTQNSTNNTQTQAQAQQQKPKFTGHYADRMGNVLDRIDGEVIGVEEYKISMNKIAGYGGRSYKYAADTKWSIENEKPCKIDKATLIIIMVDIDKEIWKKHMSMYCERVNMYNKNSQRVYSLLYGQCTESMHVKLESLAGYADMI